MKTNHFILGVYALLGLTQEFSVVYLGENLRKDEFLADYEGHGQLGKKKKK